MSITYPRLVLRGQSYRQQPLPGALEASFDAAGGTLGRAEGNHLVLEDPGKYISRSHAAVTWRDGRFYLADVGANPSIINDQPLGAGAQAALADGDCIVVGDYVLLATVETSPPMAAEADATMLAPPRIQAAPPAGPLPLFEPLLTPPAPAPSPLAALPADALSSARILDSHNDGADMHDPLGLNLLGDIAPAHSGGAGRSTTPRYRGAESDHLPPEWQAFSMPPATLTPTATQPTAAQPAASTAKSVGADAPTTFAASAAVTPLAPAVSTIPADYDPLADFLPAEPTPPTPPAPADTAISAATPLSTPLAEAPAAPAAPAATQPPAPLTGALGGQAEPAAPAAALSTAAAPSPAPPVTAPGMPAAVAPPASASGTDQSILQALLEGLGLPNLRTDRAPEALAREIGQMLRAATAGTMEVLMARALTKRESHIDMTMIVPRANNPLKFFPDVDTALTQMLGNQIPGYLPPVDAITGAFDDLKAHELAVIAGMRAALAAVVQRFDPARIEQRLTEPGRIDKLLPGGRKARLWDRLVQSYGELARDADEDLQRLFGEKFSLAYEQQVARLRQQRAGDTTSTPI